MRKSRLIDASYVKTYLQKRDRQLHKGSCGRLLVIAGSRGMAGAAILCARGALRTGAGLVQVSVPQELYSVIHGGVAEATCVSRRTSDWNLDGYQAIAIGPGLGVTEDNETLMRTVLTEYKGTVVADADALNLLAKSDELLSLAENESRSCQLIVTPHPGEAGRLLGCEARVINQHREESARRLAETFNAVAVLKGASTVVATPRKETYINSTGNPGMATGGSGDVLTGTIVSLAGQGLRPLEAACCGVYLHGMAGDLGAGYWGEYGLIASDIADAMALALKQVTESPGMWGRQENIGV